MKNYKNILAALIAVVLIGLVVIAFTAKPKATNTITETGIDPVTGEAFPTKTNVSISESAEKLAQCVADSGAKFYGAYWCPHCADQKAVFGKFAKKLPYVECSKIGGREQTDACKAEKIESYPTWKFADGTVISRVLSLQELASRTDCPFIDNTVTEAK